MANEQQHVVLVTSVQEDIGCCSCSYRSPNYKAKLAKIVGVTQICVGISCIGLQAGAIAYYSETWSALFMQGIWCGVFFILSGSFTLAAGFNKLRGMIITNMILNIISLLFVCPLVWLSTFGIIGEDQIVDLKYKWDKHDGHRAFFITITALGVVQFFATLIGAVLACLGLNSRPHPKGAQVKYSSS